MLYYCIILYYYILKIVCDIGTTFCTCFSFICTTSEIELDLGQVQLVTNGHL